jgi:hypothetical protein
MSSSVIARNGSRSRIARFSGASRADVRGSRLDKVTRAARRARVYLGDERINAGEGAVVHIPGGTAHTIRNETDAEAQAFVVFTPGTEMERFVRAVAASPGDILSLAEEHGIEMLAR